MFLLLIGLAACASGESAVAGPVEANPIVLGPENVFVVRRDRVAAGPHLTGSLQPGIRARLRAETSGAVVQVAAELGERVQEGQMLARLESSAIRAAFLSAKSAVVSAQNEVEVTSHQLARARGLIASGSLAPRDLELAESAAATSQSHLEESQARLASSVKHIRAVTVRAPFDGVVSAREVNLGEVVSSGAPLFTLIRPESMRLEAHVSMTELSALRTGTPVRFRLIAMPNEVFGGEIKHVAPNVDPLTREIRLLVSVPEQPGPLLAGLFAEGRVLTHQREALVIPTDAVDWRDETPLVRRIREGRVEQVPVTLGIRDDEDERHEVQEGLAVGDIVLRSSAGFLATGTRVAISAVSATGPTIAGQEGGDGRRGAERWAP